MTELTSPLAEESIVGTLLSEPTRAAEVVTDLLSDSFADQFLRSLYEAIRNAYYAGTAIEPITIADKAKVSVTETQRLADEHSLSAAPLREHAVIVRRSHDRRELVKLANAVIREVEKDELEPGAIAGRISQRSLSIATRSVIASEIVNFGDAGRKFINVLTSEREAAQKGIALGAKVGIPAIDSYTRGIRPGRLVISAGEPGVGKSAIWWMAALNHAKAQLAKPEERRIGTLVLSMEMGDQDSSARFAQRIGEVDGDNIQDALITDAEMRRITERWAALKDIPLYLNYSPNLRCSEMLALVAEGCRRYNAGLVIVDHFRTFDLDKRIDDSVKEDEEKARFLREEIARAMNVAVVCIAHTRKPNADRNHGRPHMADLRGSGQISAHTDGLCFVYRPIMYATEEEIGMGTVSDTDCELIWRKNRQGALGTGKLFFDPAKMDIR